MDRFPKKPCKFCGGRGHFPYKCFQNPKNKKNRYRSIKGKGKYAKQWDKTRDTWIRNNPPPINDTYWECYLRIHDWCPGQIDLSQLTLDHVVSRSRDETLRFEQSNLKPACIYCNNKKGSKPLDRVK